MSHHSIKGKWTKAEDVRLKELSRQYGTENWPFISAFFPQRTEVQCQQRWNKVSGEKVYNYLEWCYI